MENKLAPTQSGLVLASCYTRKSHHIGKTRDCEPHKYSTSEKKKNEAAKATTTQYHFLHSQSGEASFDLLDVEIEF